MHQVNIYTSLLQAFEIFTWPCTAVSCQPECEQGLDIDRHSGLLSYDQSCLAITATMMVSLQFN